MVEARRIAVVGNAPSERVVAAQVDGCDVVVRLNKARGLGGLTGKRVDELVLINCGGQMEEWLRTGVIERSPAFRTASTIALPIHPRKADLIVPPLSPPERNAADGQDYSEAARARYAALGKTVRAWDADFFARSMDELGHAPLRRHGPAPSTGYLAVRWWLTADPSCHVEAFGFGFAGWWGHDWDGERRWFQSAAARGRLTLHPLEASAERRAA
ncbi:hypothetical protein [Acuticoccus sp.]|uniref:hypothetical protein n=1 Tax=Acuticoccus sp. TaxID=1904378 RepID=UPI003B51FC88